MQQQDDSEPIKIYLDDQEEPFKEEQPPLRFNFSTIHLPDGPHVLRVEASNGLAPPTLRKIPFTVRNGVALTVSGLREGQTIGGQVELIVNAYAGNTEVDFEPRRAETPQPIPTWAWVLLLSVLAWTLFTLLNPTQAFDALTAERRPEAEVGQRLYTDTCARCHGETGEGRWLQSGPAEEDGHFYIPKLRDETSYALADTPFKLLKKVVLGVPNENVPMPGWGPILSNEEIVAVVNHVRTTWHHDASIIDLRHRRPPAAIEALEVELEQHLKAKDHAGLGRCCWPKGSTKPILYRTDETLAKGHDDVARAWKNYFVDLGPKGAVTKFKLTEKRYDYEPATVDQHGAIVIGMGRIFLKARGETGKEATEQGRFIRVYRLTVPKRKRAADGELLEQAPSFWSLVFDFADIQMHIGCGVGFCAPGRVPNGGATPEGNDPVAGTDPNPIVASGDSIGYAGVQAIIKATGKGAGSSPHDDFWTLPYEEFIAFDFSEDPDDDVKWENVIKLIVPGDPDKSNFIRALEGKPVLVTLPDGKVIERPSIKRMPKNGPFVPAADFAKLRAWVAAGCPEQAGGPAHPDTVNPSAGNAPPPGPVASASVGFKDIVQLIVDLKKGAGSSPHDDFWTLPYEEFIAFDFSEDPDDDVKWENVIKLVVPGNPEQSNFLRALEGKPVLVTLPGGKVIERASIKRMPKNGPFLSAAGIAKVRQWILDGCPETAGGAPHPLAIASGEAQPPKDGGTPPPAPVVASIGFEDVVKYLADLGKTASTVPHGSFWAELKYAEFVAFTFPRNYGDEHEYRLLVPYDAKASNLIKVLVDGEGVLRTSAGGGKIVEDLPRMPKNAAPMPKDRLAKLIEWIDAGCPEFAGKPSAISRDAAAGPAKAKPVEPDEAPPAAGGFPAPAGPAPAPEDPKKDR